jgi:hypothetical protein
MSFNYNGVNYAVNPTNGKKWKNKEEFENFDWTKFAVDCQLATLEHELAIQKDEIKSTLEKATKEHLDNDLYATRTTVIKKLKETLANIEKITSIDELKSAKEYLEEII